MDSMANSSILVKLISLKVLTAYNFNISLVVINILFNLLGCSDGLRFNVRLIEEVGKYSGEGNIGEEAGKCLPNWDETGNSGQFGVDAVSGHERTNEHLGHLDRRDYHGHDFRGFNIQCLKKKI